MHHSRSMVIPLINKDINEVHKKDYLIHYGMDQVLRTLLEISIIRIEMEKDGIRIF